MYLGVITVVLGMLLAGIGIILVWFVTISPKYGKTLADFIAMCHDKKYLCGWACFFLGVFILVGPMFALIHW